MFFGDSLVNVYKDYKANIADLIMAPGGTSLTDALKDVKTFSYNSSCYGYNISLKINGGDSKLVVSRKYRMLACIHNHERS